MKLTLETSIQQNKNILASDIDGDKVMMSIENSEYYGLGLSGSFIWDQLETTITINDLVNCVIVKYNVSKEKCFNDILPFLENLHEKDL